MIPGTAASFRSELKTSEYDTEPYDLIYSAEAASVVSERNQMECEDIGSNSKKWIHLWAKVTTRLSAKWLLSSPSGDYCIKSSICWGVCLILNVVIVHFLNVKCLFVLDNAQTSDKSQVSELNSWVYRCTEKTLTLAPTVSNSREPWNNIELPDNLPSTVSVPWFKT